MNTKLCPSCSTAIPATAPGGFCPACLLRDAAEPTPAGRAAPSLAEVAAAFPTLEILSLLGQGGMGSVYLVRQPSLDRTVALKLLAPELSRDPAFAERFAREARTLGKLNHVNIVTVYEHGESGGFYYLIMEYVDGVNLRQAMRAGRFTPEQALSIVPGICGALQAAHDQGIWHRDIKPENILLDQRGGVKIVDFGIARLVGDPQRDFTLTRTGAALGSAAYMAPEQHEKPHDVDHRADIYSLGVIIYEMLTGELPLGRFPNPSQCAAVNARIDEIVLRTLEKERELRQQSADEVRTQVLALAFGEQAQPEYALPGRRVWESVSARRLLGMPLYHIVRGPDPATGRPPVARAFFAIGPVANGVFALGGRARGFFAMGGLSYGVISIGGLSCGLLAFGGMSLGLLLAVGGVALAPLALGGNAGGIASLGGQIWTLDNWAGHLMDPDRIALSPRLALLLWMLKIVSVSLEVITLGLLQMSLFARHEPTPPQTTAKSLHVLWIVIAAILAAILLAAGIYFFRHQKFQSARTRPGTYPAELAKAAFLSGPVNRPAFILISGELASACPD